MPAGATPLDPDEAAGLLPGHIATREQLDEWESENILAGEARERYLIALRAADAHDLAALLAFVRS